MLTENNIIINAPIEKIFDMAEDVLRWPDILPHYRWVKLISHGDGFRVVEMAAHRDGLPVKWTSIQEPVREKWRIIFRHVKGPTTGMYVEWNMREDIDGVHVRITHEFDPPWPLIGPFLAKHIVGGFFVHNIAGKTLATIKRLTEGGV